MQQPTHLWIVTLLAYLNAGLAFAAGIPRTNGDIEDESYAISEILSHHQSGHEHERIVLRALVVFVRFRDDQQVLTGCTEQAKQWRHPDQLPELAEYMLADQPHPPFDRRSLTDYYYEQSNGHLVLYGTVYPEVYVTARDEAGYGVNGTNPGALTPEILHFVNRDGRIDLSDYDQNSDGILDYVIFIVRRLKKWVSPLENASGFGATGYDSKVAEFGNSRSNLKKAAPGNGAYVRYENPGNIFPGLNLIRLTAHEFGHSIWGNDHLIPITGTRAVPANDPGSVGYLLMAGPGNRAGSMTISAVERDMLQRGWIECVTLRRDTTVQVADLYSSDTSNCFNVETEAGVADTGKLYLTNRQRVGHFEKLRTESCYGSTSEHGLMTTGLLVTKVDQASRVAVLAADNSLDLSVLSASYQGDMFGPHNKTQLTPWSNPSIHGVTSYPQDFELGPRDYQAIDDIRADATDSLKMAFDYLTDFRQQPSFRVDSRIGPESGDLTIVGPSAAVAESSLHLATNVTIIGSLTISPGSILRVDEQVVLTVDTLQLESGAFVDVRGTVQVNHLFLDRGAEFDTGTSGEVIEVTNTTAPDRMQRCPPSACATEVNVFPNPANGQVAVRISITATMRVRVAMYDPLGRQVAKPVQEFVLAPGSHTMRWNTSGLAAGQYYVRTTGDDFVDVTPLAVIH